ncbi:unnamed protein product [Euphydryas editha]|uniref:FLYWCH-type domain-containing protein n=1 Tax=Euphydryas editha TaxID=104508 RepID=A0AAU9TF44_EUPED|nr:unnamed protein product [Euphydryas editha]
MYIESKRSGNPLLLYSGYTYSLKKYKTTKDLCQKKLWRCSTHTNRGCQAGLVMYKETIIRFHIIKSRRGTSLLSLGGITFRLHSQQMLQSHVKKIWRCSRFKNCKAKVHTIDSEIFGRRNGEEEREDLNLKNQEERDEDFEFFPSRVGTRLLRVGGFSFSEHFTRKIGESRKTRWRCSQHSKFYCNAIVYTYDDVIISSKLDHNHENSNRRRRKKQKSEMKV